MAWRSALAARRRWPAGPLVPGLLGIAVLLAAGALWQPYDPAAIDLGARHLGTSLAHPFGTDQLGRDMLSRTMVGGGYTLAVVATVALVSVALGTAVGLGAAVCDGLARAALLRAADFAIVMPSLVVALAITGLFGLTPLTAGLALGLGGWGPYALLTHALARRAMAQPYVRAAQALGVGSPGILLRHVVPAATPAVLTYLAADAGRTVVAYAALAFIGLGADTSRPDWGAMLYEYRAFIFDAPMLMIWPGLAVTLTALALHLLIEPDADRLAGLRRMATDTALAQATGPGGSPPPRAADKPLTGARPWR